MNPAVQIDIDHGRELARNGGRACIERVMHGCSQPLTNEQRDARYRERLARSPLYDRHDHALRVASGLAAMARLTMRWKALAKRRASQARKAVDETESQRGLLLRFRARRA